MRVVRALRPAMTAGLLAVLLAACVAPALLLPGRAQLMGALLRPLVKERMTALLGPRDVVEVFSERVERAAVTEIEALDSAAVAVASTVVPPWPSVMQAWVAR